MTKQKPVTKRDIQNYLLRFLIAHGVSVEGDFDRLISLNRAIEPDRNLRTTAAQYSYFDSSFERINGASKWTFKITKKGMRLLQQKRNLDEPVG